MTPSPKATSQWLPLVNKLLEAYRQPSLVESWNMADWGLALRQARSANLVASFASKIDTKIGTNAVPLRVQAQFIAANNIVQQRNLAALWECNRIYDALRPLGIEPVFLKGAAYVVAGLPLSHHRQFTDIDLIVPRNKIPDAETGLMLGGWLATNTDPYDQHYYRKWMHEIPPLRHIRRGTIIDVHHALSPLTARYRERTETVLTGTQQASQTSTLRVLCPTDMVLHAALHLFSEGETDNSLRNLIDISELLEYFCKIDRFDDQLVARAFEVNLSRPLYYAVRYLRMILGGSFAEKAQLRLDEAAPPKIVIYLMDTLYTHVFQGTHPSVRTRHWAWAKQALFLRGHWLRMPLHLLLPHLLRKSIRALLSQHRSQSAAA